MSARKRKVWRTVLGWIANCIDISASPAQGKASQERQERGGGRLVNLSLRLADRLVVPVSVSVFRLSLDGPCVWDPSSASGCLASPYKAWSLGGRAVYSSKSVDSDLAVD
ncbi:hypothetical protein NW759_003653 [Fusarium solani]|nr:hypothetical protein NW759_003653 [Fusarium solani]